MKLTIKSHLTIIFFAALIIRLCTFIFYVQHNERYHQSDSMDYHNCALGIALGTGMHRIDTHEPIFWRVPGYPAYLGFFYRLCGVNDPKFNSNRNAQVASLIAQISISAFLPLLLFILACELTGISYLGFIAAWASVFHLGFVLASTFLLTEALALIFFLLFLIFLYRFFTIVGEHQSYKIVKNIVLAAIMLGIFAWFRPMGEFVAVTTTLMIVVLSNFAWRKRLLVAASFFALFFALIMPWCLRNHALTGKWFFAPMSGPYLNSFVAPKIVREVQGLTLAQSISILYQLANREVKKQEAALKGTGLVVAKETVCGSIAWPIILEYPWIAAREWIKEVFKTAFDLYASQLVAFANGSWKYDDLEEFLAKKVKDCLYAQPMPPLMRGICWVDFIVELLKWFGLFVGFGTFMLYPLLQCFKVGGIYKKMGTLWLKTTPLIAGIIFMTGGFGYARLRLPVEGLMIILALTGWWWLLNRHKYATIKTDNLSQVSS